jgi:hypothetical protein
MAGSGRGRERDGGARQQTRLDAGQGLAGLPGSILQMTSDPLQVIDPKNLPVDPVTCKPIDPNQYLRSTRSST